MASAPITWWQIEKEKLEAVTDLFSWAQKITVDGECNHAIKRHLLLGREAMTNIESILKNRDITLLPKIHIVKAKVFPVVMYRCVSWTIKKAEHQRIDAFWTVVLEKTPEISLDSKKIKPVNPKGNQPWIFIGRTEAEAEAPIPWPPDANNQLIGKDPDDGKDWRQKEKGVTEGWDGWILFKCITFIMHFIIMTSAPPQIIRH